MTDASYPEPLVVESAAACPGLARLPRLPVRILVLSAPTVDAPESKGLAPRLEALCEALGVAAGVVVVDQTMAGWELMPGSTERRRFDIVLLRPDQIPPAADAADEPADSVVDTLARVLADLETRFWVLDPPPRSDPDDDVRRMKLCRRLVDRGTAPVVLIPPGWEPDALLQFHEDLLERVLHDAALVKAVARATGDLRPLPAVFRPAGGRHGLELGRLLENHRQRIDDESSAVRMFQREVEAARPVEAAPEPEQQTWQALNDGVARRLHALEAVRVALEEINRDRDPPGWSRLAATIDELRAIEEEGRRDREQLEAIRLVARASQ